MKLSRRTSFVLEALLREATRKELALVLEEMKTYFGFVITNRQGSHVAQTLLTRAYAFLASGAQLADKEGGESSNSSSDGESDSDEEDKDEKDDQNVGRKNGQEPKNALKTTIMDLCATLVAKEIWWNMLFDPFATHVLRSLILLLAEHDPSSLRKSNARQNRPAAQTSSTCNTRKRRRKVIDPELNASLHAFLNAMSQWPSDDLKRACTNPHASPVLQLLFEHCSFGKQKKAWVAAMEKILCSAKSGEEADSDVFHQFAKDRIASHLLETIVSRCDEATFSDFIFAKCLCGEMADMCENPTANFVLQHALANIRTQEQCVGALDELEPLISENLLENRLGVVWRLCQACKVSDKAVQRRACRAVIKGVRSRTVSSSVNQNHRGVAEALLDLKASSDREKALSSYDNDDGNGNKNDDDDAAAAFKSVNVSILGARVVSALLELSPESCRALFESIASMNSASLKTCCTDPIAGKLVMEVLMDAPSTGAWAKQRVLLKLKDDLTDVAANKFGWHVVRKAYDSGGLKEKTQIVKALERSERKLVGSKSGALLLKHCKVYLYRTRPEQWQAAVKISTGKRRQSTLNNMLDDLDAAGARFKHAKRKKEV